MIPTNPPNSTACVNSEIWPPERIEHLKTLRLEGHSASEIADILGCSKNSVIGKLHRLGMLTKQPTDPTRVSRARPARVAPVTPLPRPIDLPQRRGKPVKLTELQHWMCRFGLGDPRSPDSRFCGEPTIDDKSSWCAACAKRVFVVMPARLRRSAA